MNNGNLGNHGIKHMNICNSGRQGNRSNLIIKVRLVNMATIIPSSNINHKNTAKLGNKGNHNNISNQSSHKCR